MPANRHLDLRRLISLLLLLLGLVLAYSGAVLFISPQGRIAHWTDWRFLGLDKDQIGAVHTLCALLFVGAGALHVWYNGAAIVRYLADRTRWAGLASREALVAIILVAGVTVGSAASLPPFAWLMQGGEAAKGWWERREGSPPWSHAEESTLAGAADDLGITMEQAGERLRNRGWAVPAEDQRLRDIAAALGVAPADLWSVLSSEDGSPASAGATGRPEKAGQGGQGLGRLTLRAWCEREGRSLPDSLARLQALGVQADGETSLKELATALHRTPTYIVTLLEE